MSTTLETVGRVTPKQRGVPSRMWYWVAAAVVLLGTGLGVTWGVTRTLQTYDHAHSLVRTAIPGKLTLQVDEGASRLVYFEGEGRPGLGTLGLSVTGPDGSAVPVQAYDAIMKYEIAGWAGTPVGSFPTPERGTYTVTARAPQARGGISVGDNFVRTQALVIVAALAVTMTSFVCGFALLVVIWRQRARNASAHSQE